MINPRTDVVLMQPTSVTSRNCPELCKGDHSENNTYDTNRQYRGAACTASLQGVPATAFSGVSGAHVSYTTLASDPKANSTVATHIYSALTLYFVDTLFNSDDGPTLPPQVIVNVNYAAIGNCSSADDYEWIFTRNRRDGNAVDVETCGSNHLPSEAEVIRGKGCYASVSAISAVTKTDVDASTQAEVFEQLQGLPFSCYNN